MARYIDADILAKIVFDKWQECDELKHIIPAIRNVVMCASDDDVVKVVRCKDCKYCAEREDHFGTLDVCTNCTRFGSFGMYMSPNDFCSEGERREDE